MAIYLYNSLSRKKEEFIPLNPPQVNIYTCGVTVYDESHIGHARSLYIFDVITRYLRYKGFKVNFVRNITDIDDKIINRANELKISWKDLVKKYIDSYHEDLKLLNIDKADYEPCATENISEMIEYIKKLIDQGYAYITESGVYFKVRQFREYGKLSGQGIDQMIKGVRIEPDEKKRDPLDFALWKISKPDEPAWTSPWGKGRPGWHIECSVMSQKFLKTETLDIHGGGRDLIFPHHENEIAQTESITKKPFARYWIHHGLLTINGQKMAKSLGNFISIKDFIARYKEPDILKLFFLSAHYSQPIDYTEEKIKETVHALERILILLVKINQRMPAVYNLKQDVVPIHDLKNRFIEAMDDDFNTPKALAVIFDLVNLTNKNIDNLNFILKAKILLEEFKKIFGLSLSNISFDTLSEEIKTLIGKRNNARKRGDFKEADRIRKELEQKGIILEDTKEGTTWRRKL
ncbi:MAG: cysteine--tRNA ligase [Candidatus Omnitrophica bacterium]|nr:cysteine--tRNA ligase [Candidatus Omnitrophota bacterium]